MISQDDPLSIGTPDGVEFCNGTPVRLTIDTDNDIEWSTGETMETIWVNESGEYSAMVLNDCGDLVTTEIVTLTEVVPDTPMEDTFFVTLGGDLSIVLPQLNGTYFWFDQSGTIIDSNILNLTNIMSDQTYFVENSLMLSNGQFCRSEGVAINVVVINGTTGYRDNDGDGYGDINNPEVFTTQSPPSGVVLNADDCDDTRANVFPGAAESCDNLDNLSLIHI